MSLPWFKMYQRPFLMATMHLTTEARGAYLLLMFSYYDQERPPVDDDEALAQITGLSVERWRHHRKLIEPFFTIEGGVWRNEKCEEEIASRHKQGGTSRKNGKGGGRPRKPASQPEGNQEHNPPANPPGFAQGTQQEPDFGPSQSTQNLPANPSGNPAGFDQVKITQEKPGGFAGGLPASIPAGGEIEDIRKKEEGANAPSPAGEVLIGSLIPEDFRLTGAIVSAAKAEGVTVDELAIWFDDWKARCVAAGTRLTNWSDAWDREYHRRMQERAKSRPRPKVSVSKRTKLTKLPDDWAPNERHHELARDRRLDIALCVESFADHITNKRPDWSDADAAFRNWLKSPHRTEFTRNGQAQPARRAPAPGGSSILDAGARFEQRLDAELARSRAPAQDQPNGDAAVLSLPEE